MCVVEIQYYSEFYTMLYIHTSTTIALRIITQTSNVCIKPKCMCVNAKHSILIMGLVLM